jgi:hypothetical protein
MAVAARRPLVPQDGAAGLHGSGRSYRHRQWFYHIGYFPNLDAEILAIPRAF